MYNEKKVCKRNSTIEKKGKQIEFLICFQTVCKPVINTSLWEEYTCGTRWLKQDKAWVIVSSNVFLLILVKNY